MAQKTAWNGAALTESDINLYLTGEGGAWTTWTPTLTQSGAVTATVTHAVYGRWGRLIIANFRLAVTGAGTGGNAVTVSLPVTAARANMMVGTGSVFDTSASLGYSGNVFLPSTTTMDYRQQGTGTATDNRIGVAGFTAALAAGDGIDGFFMYEAAT
jgi:hypothetical protein